MASLRRSEQILEEREGQTKRVFHAICLRACAYTRTASVFVASRVHHGPPIFIRFDSDRARVSKRPGQPPPRRLHLDSDAGVLLHVFDYARPGRVHRVLGICSNSSLHLQRNGMAQGRKVNVSERRREEKSPGARTIPRGPGLIGGRCLVIKRHTRC